MTRREVFAAALCVVGLAVQLIAIAAAPFTGNRVLAWAPFHEQAWVHIEATVGERTLSQAEIAARYHLRGPHWSEAQQEAWHLNEVAHVQRVIEAIEMAHPEHARARVVVSARINGAPAEAWRWPH